MSNMRMRVVTMVTSCFALASATPTAGATQNLPTEPQPETVRQQLLGLLDAPLLFVKRHSYTGIHIYDTYYKWPLGGGGIYVIENPSAPRAEWKIRAVIDPTTPETLGVGVYSHPELSWDATKLLFCFKGEPQGSTSIYEIGIDGRGLRRVTDPTSTCGCYKGSQAGQHDIAPAYLPDGRIVFLSTRPSGLVPCNNTGVAILHVMNADGSDIHPISVNNVNEFDPAVLRDGRVLFGRWEYVDKNALTIQSLWTVFPDGTNETALFANNMVFPEAVLDARPVPDSPLIAGTLAKHNGPPRGSVAFIDPIRGKNNPAAITNLEHPNEPTFDRGDSCEPWPLSQDVLLFSGRPPGQTRNVIEMMNRGGQRVVVHSDPDICLHSPMLVKQRQRPPVLQDKTDRTATTGRFFVQDIYEGLDGVKRGEVKWLRVVEETSRVSESPGGPNPYNQTFLVSAALAFSVKNYLGVVPVNEDGSAYFEVPAGRAVYLQALDGDRRLVQSMRTFVQAAPATTRSCIGCHEHKSNTPANDPGVREILARRPDRLQAESWGSGFVDYPSMVQPILDKNCVSCHGGEKGIAAGLDLSGGWTEHFNISYENLVNRRETQLVAHWISGIDCMNGTAFWSSQLFPPRSHGSGTAPLADLLVGGHDGRIPNLTRKERDLVMAWIDSNGLYHGTWNYTESGCAIKDWNSTRQALMAEMQAAGCARCHGDGTRVTHFENDWINLKDPQLSRILRAPLTDGNDGFGLGTCRDRKVNRPRLRLLWNGYAHAVQPVAAFPREPLHSASAEGESVVSFASTTDSHYQKMLSIIRHARQRALASPRVDMPGADVIAGECRQFIPPSLPETLPILEAIVAPDGVVRLAGECSAQTIGLEAELHRSDQPNFTPNNETLLERTRLFRYADKRAPTGQQYYAMLLVAGEAKSKPVFATVSVPAPLAPAAPTNLKATPASYAIRLAWDTQQDVSLRYHVYRRKTGESEFEKLTAKPIGETAYADTRVETQVPYSYVVRAVSQREVESPPADCADASAIIVREPVFEAPFAAEATGRLLDGAALPGKIHGKARLDDGVLDLTQGGYVTFPHRGEFEFGQPITVECWVRFDQSGQMPVLVSCGVWQQAGWFLQRLGPHWRWHVGGIDCDGGTPTLGQWVHLAGTYDGHTARLFQNGALVAEKAGTANTASWPGDLHVGQYSGHPGPEYQVNGRIAGLKIYHRPLDSDEVVAAEKTRSPVKP